MKNILLAALVLLCFQALAQQPVDDGLVAFYPFTGNANDASGNGLNGIVMGATLTTDRFGQPNSAYHFLAADSHYIYVPTDTLLNFSHNLTMAFWVYKESYGGPDSSTAIMSVLHKGRDIHNSYGFYTVHHTDRFYVRNFGAGGANTDVPSGLTLHNWHFVTGVLDSAANEIRFYVDGVLKQTRTGIAFEANNQYPLLIGRHYKEQDGSGGYGFPFDGKIDDVRLYNKPLTNIEVMQLYLEQCTNFSAAYASDTTLCIGDTAEIFTSGGDFYSLSPSTGNDTILSPVTTTNYMVMISRYNGCTDTHNITIHVNTAPSTPLLTASADTICSGDAVTINLATGYSNYIFTPAPGTPVDSVMTFSPAASTIYRLTITDSMGCQHQDSVTVFVVQCLGIEEELLGLVNLYPNPGNGLYTLTGSNSRSDDLDVTIFDMAGKAVMHKIWRKDAPNLEIDIRNLSNNIYFIEMKNKDHSVVRKLIKH